MKKIFYPVISLLMISTLSAQNKKLTLYYPDSTKIVNITGLDSMTIFICGASKVSYGGKDYNTVLIGNQCWLKENLDVGVMIQVSQNATNNGVMEKYCYNNEPDSCEMYGGLYQWNEAMQYSTTPGTHGICPPGWHIPTNAEFQTLNTTVNNDANALKEIGQGTAGSGTNTSGFSALFAGHRNYEGYFSGLNSGAVFWSSTEYGATNAYYLGLHNGNNFPDIGPASKDYGLSVRCIKD